MVSDKKKVSYTPYNVTCVKSIFIASYKIKQFSSMLNVSLLHHDCVTIKECWPFVVSSDVYHPPFTISIDDVCISKMPLVHP